MKVCRAVGGRASECFLLDIDRAKNWLLELSAEASRIERLPGFCWIAIDDMFIQFGEVPGWVPPMDGWVECPDGWVDRTPENVTLRADADRCVWSCGKYTSQTFWISEL